MLCLERWTQLLDDGKSVDVAYFDYAKAFDKVSHRFLKVQLRAYGIQGKLLAWIEAWLANPRQRVVVGDAKSPWLDVISGTTQRTVLGFLLFLIYIKRGSNVFVSFLYFSRAFDTVSHCSLFLKLMDRNVPLCFLMIIMFWYTNMQYNVKWCSSVSDFFDVLCGTKQGGILSPDFFALYINDLIIALKRLGVGCHIIKRFIACILFAVDMTLIAPTRQAMQQMLDVCAEYCSKFCLRFNVSKTKVMIFGKLSRSPLLPAKISLQGVLLDYVPSCKYLGFHIVSHTHLKMSINEDLCRFFASANSILNGMVKPKENVLLQLLFSNCIPRLTYGAAVKDLNSSEK